MSEPTLSDVQLALAIAQGSLSAWRGAFPDNTPDEIKARIHALEQELEFLKLELSEWESDRLKIAKLLGIDTTEPSDDGWLEECSEIILAHQNALKEANGMLRAFRKSMDSELPFPSREKLSAIIDAINSVLGESKCHRCGEPNPCACEPATQGKTW